MEAKAYLICDVSTGKKFWRKYTLRRRLKVRFPAPRYQILKIAPVIERDQPCYSPATYELLLEKGLFV
jgi:hypothetical protein